MTPWQDRRDAARLDEAIEAMLRGDSPVETRSDLTQAAGTLLAARADLARDVVPDRAAMSSARIRLVAEAERLAAAPASLADTRPDRRTQRLTLPARTSRRPRALAALVAGAVIAGTGASTAMAAQGSLPGEALYPVKLLVERAQLVGDSPTEAARERLDQAGVRLSEAAELAAQGGPGSQDLAAGAVEAFAARATEGGAALLAAEQTGEDGSAAEVRDFSRSSRRDLQQLSGAADGDLLTALVTAAETVYALDNQVEAVCPTCVGDAAPLAPFARAAERAAGLLDDLSAGPVSDPLLGEAARAAAEQAARRTPRAERPGSATDRRPGNGASRPDAQPGNDGSSGAERPGRPGRDPLLPSLPVLPDLPDLPRVSDLPVVPQVPVVGSTLEDVEQVVEDTIGRQLREQVDGLTGEGGLGGLLP